MPLSSPLCRIGRKRPIREILKSKSPKDFKIYVEPFVGTGDMYFYYDLDDSQKAFLNDKDVLISNTLQQIKRNPNIDNISKFDKMSVSQIQAFVNKSQSLPIDKLAKNLYIMCNTFGGTAKGKIYKDSNIYTKLKKIPKLSAYMKNTTVTNADWTTTFKHDSPNTFFFIDPPYEKSKGLYKDPIINYEKLNNRLRKIKGKFMLTMNDSKEIRDLFSSFSIRGITVRGSGKVGVGVGVRKEVIITNY